MRTLFFILLILHGLIHLMGFVKAYNLTEINELTHSISKGMGLIWLFCTILFLTSAGLFITGKDIWWLPGGIALLVSQMLIFQTWSDAKFGTLANLIILLPLLAGFFNSQPSSFKNKFISVVESQMEASFQSDVLQLKDVQHLPKAVQKYLHFTGSIGQPKIDNFRARIGGKMKMAADGDWVDIKALQFNFYAPKSRSFYITSALYGIPFDGLHLYLEDSATMQIKVGGLVKVANASGKKMTQSETVTLFNDMCIFAPATLIDSTIQWKEIDNLTVEAKFSNAGYSISAKLFFDASGALIDFSSEDRYESSDGKTYNNYRWSTPIKNYKSFGNRNIPTYGEAIWHKPEGPFIYAKFDIQEVTYNRTENSSIFINNRIDIHTGSD